MLEMRCNGLFLLNYTNNEKQNKNNSKNKFMELVPSIESIDRLESMQRQYQHGYDTCKKEYEERLRWIPLKEELPMASEDKSKWWTSDIGEVFPYSEECIVENENGNHFIAKYSVLEKCWDVWCGNVVKWRYLELK